MQYTLSHNRPGLNLPNYLFTLILFYIFSTHPSNIFVVLTLILLHAFPVLKLSTNFPGQ
jgi:hypothetical protein